MPTIIDSFVVNLGLNSKDLQTKGPAATKQLSDIETQGKKATKSVSDLSQGFLKLFAVIGGSLALKTFVSDFIDTNAQLERFSRNIGLSVPTISAWGNAVEEMGGSAKDAQGTLDMLSRAQTDLLLTGTSSLIPYLSMLGIALADVTGKARPVDEVLLDLSDRFSRIDRTTANNLGRMMGIDQNTLNLLLQGRKEVELTIQRQKDFRAASKEQTAEAAKLQKAIIGLKQDFVAFGRDLLMQASPAIEYVLQKLKDFVSWAKDNKEFIKDFLTIMAAELAAVGLAVIPFSLLVVSVLALSAALALLYQDYQTWQRGGNSFIDWQIWLDRVNAVKDAIKALSVEIDNMAKKATGLLDKIPGYAAFDKWFTNKDDANKVATATSNAVSSAGTGIASAVGAQSSSRYVQKWFEDHGWSAAQAAAITANLKSENSKFDPKQTGDKGTAIGVAQWHPDRQADFKALFGKDIGNASLEEQLAFVNYELTQGSRKSAGDALHNTNDTRAGAEIVSRRYESPKDADGAARLRGDMAVALMGTRGASSGLAGAGSGSGAAGNVDQSKTVNTGDIKIYTQATDAEGIAGDIGQSMNYLLTSQANGGLR